MKRKILTAKVTVYTPENVIGTAVISNTVKNLVSDLLVVLDINNIQQYKFNIYLLKE